MCDCKEKLSALEVENAELKTRLARLEARAQTEAASGADAASVAEWDNLPIDETTRRLPRRDSGFYW